MSRDLISFFSLFTFFGTVLLFTRMMPGLKTSCLALALALLFLTTRMMPRVKISLVDISVLVVRRRILVELLQTIRY